MTLGGREEHDNLVQAGRRPIRRALISVYDKTGLAELARGLDNVGVDIVSTGSTAKTIAGAGVPVAKHRKGLALGGVQPCPQRWRSRAAGLLACPSDQA